jgi:protein O-GlcNAc transferase
VSTVRFDEAIACQQRGDLARAEAICIRLLRLQPAHAGAWHLRGLLALQQSNLERGIAHIRKSLALNARQPAAHVNAGTALRLLGRNADAAAHFASALEMIPNDPALLLQQGNLLFELARYEDALASYDRAARVQQPSVELLNNRGNALRELARHEEAVASFRLALSLDPSHPEILNNLGNSLLDMKRVEEALTYYESALQLQPDFANALENRGLALTMINQPEDAAKSYASLLRAAPDRPFALSSLFHSRVAGCDWRFYGADRAALLGQVARATPVQPSVFMLASDSAELLARCTVPFVAANIAPAVALWSGESYRHERLRIAYLSADFRQHAVSYAMAGVWEHHDRMRFETLGISFAGAELDPMGKRVVGSFEKFVNVAGYSDREVATMIRTMEVDIVVDLMGLTRWCRPGIYANRPAPCQVNFLGYPGTMGSAHWDYLIADGAVIPTVDEKHYTETVVRLPRCCLPTDDQRTRPAPPSRTQARLPSEGLVFCAFTNAYKINPPMFAIWMRLLRETPGSVLWLREMGSAACTNITHEAHRHGVDAARLVFAPHVEDMAQHLSRQGLADLYLDTHPYNAHSTAADALWAGVPVLTCRGESFASRVASSALESVDLSELITHNLADYEALALALTRDRDRLLALRARLASRHGTAPLFDTAGYTRDLETAYLAMHHAQSARGFGSAQAT